MFDLHDNKKKTQVQLGQKLVFDNEIVRTAWYWQGKSPRHLTQFWGKN